MSNSKDIQSVTRTLGSVHNVRADHFFVFFWLQENPYLFTKTNSNTVMSELISDDDQDSATDDFPPAAAVALAVCLTAVVVIVVVFVWRTRKSRRRPEARKLLYAPGPHKPRIWTCPELASVLVGAGDGKRRSRRWIKRFSRSAFSPYFSRTYNDHESEKFSKQEGLLLSHYCLYTVTLYILMQLSAISIN